VEFTFRNLSGNVFRKAEVREEFEDHRERLWIDFTRTGNVSRDVG